MNTNFCNPFADYGSIVRGERFIGRSDGINDIENRVIRPSEPGNLAIIGNYRIGKSSLLYKGIMDRRNDLIAKRRLPIWINLATFETASSFFRALVTSVYNEMKDLGWLTEQIQNAEEKIQGEMTSTSDEYGRIQRFFEKVRQANCQALFILDEFDHARYLFKNDISGFQKLRELSYRPEWRVTFITASRRSLRDIELQTRAISTFDLIFLKHNLGMFNNDDLSEYFERMKKIGIDIGSNFQERIKFYCGGHPFLLEVLGYEVVELFRATSQVDVDVAAKKVGHTFIDQYDHLIRILSEDGDLNKILQILFGPVFDINQINVDTFLRYGLIHPDEEDNYVAFSEHFQTYLKLIERYSELWPLWRDTELGLRNCIHTSLSEQYGDDWIPGVEKRCPNLKPIFAGCRDAQQKETASFGNRTSSSLLDYSYPQDLFQIIFSNWNIFKPIFGKDKNYWGRHSETLSKIRNPLVHNRDLKNYDYLRIQAEGYCNEILTKLEPPTLNSL